MPAFKGLSPGIEFLDSTRAYMSLRRTEQSFSQVTVRRRGWITLPTLAATRRQYAAFTQRRRAFTIFKSMRRSQKRSANPQIAMPWPPGSNFAEDRAF